MDNLAFEEDIPIIHQDEEEDYDDSGRQIQAR